jgi:DNA (cytosine-5)-methyltransferase 1
MKIGSLFTGYGGLDLAVEQHYGAETVWTSDIDPGASKIIAHRFPHAPNLGDLTKIDWSTVEPIDILTGGFPCQDVSTAGKRAGMRPDTRSGLWTHMAYAINTLRPRYVIAENVRGLLSAEAHSKVEPCAWCVGETGHGKPDLRALGAVQGDLAELGYDSQWCGLLAADIGAPHNRFRVFVVAADTNSLGRERRGSAWDGRAGLAHHNLPATHTASDGRHERGTEPARQLRRPDAALSGASATANPAGTERGGTQPNHLCATPRPATEPRERASTDWGPFAAAIHRWEHISGRLAPAPTEPGPKGNARLSPAFVEWMMGLPAGWVTDVPGLNRNAQLKALGNGVVPQQALEALRRINA